MWLADRPGVGCYVANLAILPSEWLSSRRASYSLDNVAGCVGELAASHPSLIDSSSTAPCPSLASAYTHARQRQRQGRAFLCLILLCRSMSVLFHRWVFGLSRWLGYASPSVCIHATEYSSILISTWTWEFSVGHEYALRPFSWSRQGFCLAE